MVPASINFDDRQLDKYSDDELESHIHQSPHLETIRMEGTRLLSPFLVAKLIYWPDNPWDEVQAIERAAAAGIRVPTVRRIVSLSRNNHAIIMDRISEQTLEELWPTLGFWSTLRIGWQLRRAIATLRSIKSSSSSGGLHTGQVVSEWIQGIYMPIQHSTPASFTDYLNWWLTCARRSVLPPRPELLLKTPSYHVLVHQDLVPRNMIMDDSVFLWIVDWGHAGYYPAFMEALAMATSPYSSDNAFVTSSSWVAKWGRIRWHAVRLLACGWSPYFTRQQTALRAVRQRSLTFRLERAVNSARY